MTTVEFKNAITALNESQKQAVEAIEGPVMVIAGPGTGKTQILTLRIANILFKTQINPENILALTYTVSGVHAMRKRLVEIIGTPGYRVDINTFHGFCNDIIKSNPEEFPNLISSDSAEDLEQIQIVEEVIDNNQFQLLRPFGDRYFYVKTIISTIGDLKKEGVTVDKFVKVLQKQEEDFEKIEDLYHEKGSYKGKMKSQYEKLQKNIYKNKELAIAYKHYQEMMQERKLYDYSDMLLEVIKVFESNKQFLMRMQEQYQYMLVDEHQDTNSAQNKIIELLCSFYSNPNLFVVGDDKQSIYRFQGASLANFLYFKNLYPESLLINLQDNYRSSQIILDASGGLISNNILASKFMLEKAKLQARQKHLEEKIKIIVASDFYAEYYCVADAIKLAMEKGTEFREIAVLAKENKDLLPFVEIFDQKSIPYVLETNQNLLYENDIQKLILLFQAIHNFGDEGDLLRAMHIDSLGISPVDVVKLINLARTNKTTVWRLFDKENYKNQVDLKSQKYIAKFYNNLLKWKIYSNNERFDFLFKNVLSESGILEAILKKQNSIQKLDDISSFYESIKQRIEKNPRFNLDDFMHFISLLEEHNVSIKRSARMSHKNGIRLMTAHGSKGLEFDLVFIINAFDGHWGNSRKRGTLFTIPWEYLQEQLTTVSDEEKIEDERRLFYVALTRARREIHISYSKLSLDGKEQISSQFIEEILDTYREFLDIEEFENKFLKNKQIMLSPMNGRDNQINEYLANKELFAEMFSRRGFAATHLNNYLKCPWRYFFRNLLELPDVMNKSLMFGSAIHKALNLYIINKSGFNKTLNFLLDSYEKALGEQPLTEDEKKELKEKGEKVLEGFYNNKVKKWKENIESELSIKGIKFSDKVTLTGKIDLIETQDNTSDVIVYDFKTGKPKSRAVIEGTTQNSDGDYKRQLIFYKILLDRYAYKKMRMTTGVIEFVEPNDSGYYKSEEFTIRDQDVKDLEEQIQKVSDEILNFRFWNYGCKKSDCEYCVLRSYIGN